MNKSELGISESLNNKKVFIDSNLWYIENILTEKEINELMIHANEKNKWYKTTRSSSIRNKFIGVNVDIHPEGTFCPTRKIDLSGDAIFPNENNTLNKKDLHIFEKNNGIFDRLEKILPPTLVRQSTLQSFWPVDKNELQNPGGAYNWHFEKGNENINDFGMTATWTIYLNENFNGGILEFLNKPYCIKPKTGMIVSVPMTKDFTHRVTPVTDGVRHTLYGTCFENIYDRNISTGENC